MIAVPLLPAGWGWWHVAAAVVAAVVIAAAIEAVSHLRGVSLPGPIGFPFIGHVPYLLKEPWFRFADFARRYGAMYTLRIWSKPFVVVSDPSIVKHMFREQAAKYIKDDWSYEYFRDILGRGLVTSEGEVWRSHRKLLAPAFDYKALERLHTVFEGAAYRMRDLIQRACSTATPVAETYRQLDTKLDRSAVSILPFGRRAVVDGRSSGPAIMELSSVFRQVTLEVISQVALGFKPEEASVFPALFEAVVDELNKRVFQPWRAFLPSAAAHNAAMARLNDIVRQRIAARRELRSASATPPAAAAAPVETAAAAVATPSAAGAGAGAGDDGATADGSGTSLSGKAIFAGGGDMLDMLLDSGVTLTDVELSDELKTQLMAGHETTSMMMTWACYLLALHPAALDKAVTEVDAVLGLAPGVTRSAAPAARVVETPSFKDYRALTYMDCVLKEAMRVFTPVPVLNRECVEPDVVGGVTIPAHTSIIISVWALHQSPEIWGDDVKLFRPERFGVEESRKRHPWAYLPFSLGERNCIGQNLSITEAKVVLGTLLRHWTISLPEGQPPPITDAFVIPVRPADKLQIVLTPRA